MNSNAVTDDLSALMAAMAKNYADKFAAWMVREDLLKEVDERVCALMARAYLAGATERRP